MNNPTPMTTQPNEPGITVTVREMYDIMRKLEHLPEQLKAMDERLERGLEAQERIAISVREELRAEVRIRDEKLAAQTAEIKAQDVEVEGLKARVTSLEAEREADKKIIEALEKKDSKKPPWTAIVAIIISAFVALSSYVKDLIN